MKRVNKTNVKKSLRECFEQVRYDHFHYGWSDLNDEWQVGLHIGWGDEGATAKLWNWEHEVELKTNRLLMWDSMTELLDWATSLLMEQYESYIESHPWVELEGAERNAFENACDYMRYGESSRAWVERGHDCGIDASRRALIWKMAWCYMANGIMLEDDWRDVA